VEESRGAGSLKVRRNRGAVRLHWEQYLFMLPTISVMVFAGLLQAAPIILSDDDLGDNYYDAAPADLLGRKSWLGLFIGKEESRENARESRLQVTQVRLVPRKESGSTIYRVVTTPPDATLLISGVPGVSAGAAVTLGRSIDLSSEKREAEFRFGNDVYRIRLVSAEPSYCDAVITLTLGESTQELFDATAPGKTKDPTLLVACDDPHFRIHWAGDLDRDGRLDMLVTFSHKYSYFPNQLLLSSVARSGELVVEVARYERFSQ